MLVGSKGPTDRQTMSVIELSWTAKNAAVLLDFVQIRGGGGPCPDTSNCGSWKHNTVNPRGENIILTRWQNSTKQTMHTELFRQCTTLMFAYSLIFCSEKHTFLEFSSQPNQAIFGPDQTSTGPTELAKLVWPAHQASLCTLFLHSVQTV